MSKGELMKKYIKKTVNNDIKYSIDMFYYIRYI